MKLYNNYSYGTIPEFNYNAFSQLAEAVQKLKSQYNYSVSPQSFVTKSVNLFGKEHSIQIYMGSKCSAQMYKGPTVFQPFSFLPFKFQKPIAYIREML